MSLAPPAGQPGRGQGPRRRRRGSCRSSRRTPTATASRRWRARLAPQADAFGVALVEEGIALRRLGHRTPDPGDGRHLDAADPALPRARPHAHRALARAPARRRGGRGRRGTPGPRAPQDRHRHGADRRPPLQRGGPARGAPRARATSTSRASTPTSRTPTRRTSLTPGCSSSASTRCCASTSAARCPCPLRHIANSAAILRLPESHLDLVRPGILLYGVYPYAGRAAHDRGEAGALVALARRLLQGRRGGQPGELRLDLEERPPRASRDRARRLRRRLLPRDVEPGAGDPARRSAVPQVGRDLHGPDHGQHRVGHRLQRRRGGADRRAGRARASPSRSWRSGRARSPTRS